MKGAFRALPASAIHSEGRVNKDNSDENTVCTLRIAWTVVTQAAECNDKSIFMKKISPALVFSENQSKREEVNGFDVKPACLAASWQKKR